MIIPKKEDAVVLEGFHPVSLINDPLQIISKILASRLSSVINSLIDKSQSAYIKGRSISDNIVAAEKLICNIQMRHLYCYIFKVDFAKLLIQWTRISSLIFLPLGALG